MRVTLVAEMVGSNRILAANKIVNPLGDADLPPAEERKLRRSIIEKALKALEMGIEEQTLI